jgi:hypothetical protein
VLPPLVFIELVKLSKRLDIRDSDFFLEGIAKDKKLSYFL